MGGSVDYPEFGQRNFTLSRGTNASSSGVKRKEEAQVGEGDNLVKKWKRVSKEYGGQKVCLYFLLHIEVCTFRDFFITGEGY